MKTNLEETKSDIPYPKLRKGKTTNSIGLFTSPSVGVILHAPNGLNNVGHYSTEWNPDNFEDLPNTVIVTLRND